MSQTWPPPGAPTTSCYRHPRAAAPVTCTRCERPICTDCMVSAPVGWQCAACAKGGPPVRRLRPDGGGWAGGSATRGVVTIGLVAINAVLFIGQQVSPQLTAEGTISALAVDAGEVHRIVTSGFLHGSILHVLFNCALLWQLGTALEARVGRARFLGLYAAGLLGGSLGNLVLADPRVSALGASGAVFGLMGGVVALGRDGRSPIEAGVGGLLLINLLITFLLPGIAIGGHLGGLAAGAAVGGAYRLLGERGGASRRAAAVAVALAVTVACAAACLPVASWAVESGGIGLRLGPGGL